MRVYHYLETKWALDDMRRRRLKLSKIDDMNDPYEFECVRSNHAPSQWVLDNTKRASVEQYAVLCFSRSWNNILMWSHYADRHKGICLGFEVPDDKARKVEYVGNIRLTGDLSEVSDTEKTGIIEQLYWTKYGGWCYEEEIRVHSSREELDKETGQYFVSFSDQLVLKEVIAGARFPMSKKPIEDVLRGYAQDVEINKAGRSTTRFEIILGGHSF